ncbi:MAG: hypothetical protein AAFX87_23725 [Bacteroidota bacterium]
MSESITLSRATPELKSMQYQFLREEGLKHIQDLAGKIWTDYNVHDPGVTMLEALCYAITDLGFRSSFDIKDILAYDPANPGTRDIRNFHTAREILTNCPVTINDYRKLMMDVAVPESDTSDKKIGVKNAWIETTNKAEFDIYAHHKDNILSYDPPEDGPNQRPLDMKILYNILLEFDESDEYGDLNENTLTDTLEGVFDGLPDPKLRNLAIKVDVKFPRWDTEEVNWDDLTSIKENIVELTLTFFNKPDDYIIEYELNEDNDVILTGYKGKFGGSAIPGLDDIQDAINDFLFNPTDGLILNYQEKVFKILEILEEVICRLHANRNLCEDFLHFNALRVEEILVCADIDLEFEADVNQVQAQIYHEIAKFLSPVVNFYSLEEMFTKCYDDSKFDLVSLSTDTNTVTVSGKLTSTLEVDDIITLVSTGENDGEYTVSSVALNRINTEFTDIVLKETMPTGIVSDEGYLFVGQVGEQKCMPVEKIFEGPKLNHGFIDNDELEKADRIKVIHVSDLIQIIMDVPGVIAVKNIQIANVPQDDPEGTIESRSVRWCMDLAFDQNYVPRLSEERSRLTFFKDQLPFQASQLEVEELLEVLQDAERPQRPENPTLDIAIPRGQYREFEDYTSVQSDLPLAYGTGEFGLPGQPDEARRAQAKQLKGYLMFFDQLLANYLSQLANVKNLFSMNSEIDRTYFTQTLFDSVPNADPLYIDKINHETKLDEIAEDKELFEERRNRFLDHLLARFTEQFSDYALLTYKISGPNAGEELIKDKLAFLNNYPKISSRRSKGFDYKDFCNIWNVNNVSGLRDRASFLAGIDPWGHENLIFSDAFILADNPPYQFKVQLGGSDFLESVSYASEEDMLEGLERAILAGLCQDNYLLADEDESGDYHIELYCGDMLMATSIDEFDEPTALTHIDDLLPLFSNEFYTNYESNRNNLAIPYQGYFEITTAIDMVANPPEYIVTQTLYKEPFTFDPAQAVLFAEYKGEGEFKEAEAVINVDAGNDEFTIAGDFTSQILPDEVILIADSQDNDGDYTVQSVVLDSGNTRIKVNESVTSNAAPLGDLLYNVTKREELEERAAEEAANVTPWEIIFYGSEARRYACGSTANPTVCTDNQKAYRITGRTGEVVAKGAGKFTVQQTIAFLSEKFFSHEGLHVVEHILLRPKVKDLFADADGETLTDELLNLGTLVFEKNETIAGAVAGSKGRIEINGDIVSQLRIGMSLRIVFADDSEETHILHKSEFNGATTTIQLESRISDATPFVGATLFYDKSKPINSIDDENKEIVVDEDADLSAKSPGDIIRVTKSQYKRNDGIYTIGSLSTAAGETTIVIDQVKIQDDLLPIYLGTDPDIIEGENCDACKVDNPYACIAQVVVPAWPGRFSNTDFRKFFERTLRVEAPAHVFLNICWINPQQMEEFELLYKTWLVENAKPEKDNAKLSKALNALIDILERLRNVYPVKTLHDCEEDDTLLDSIILNNSALGEI